MISVKSLLLLQITNRELETTKNKQIKESYKLLGNLIYPHKFHLSMRK